LDILPLALYKATKSWSIKMKRNPKTFDKLCHCDWRTGVRHFFLAIIPD
jgi:hypothetical protein